MSLRNLSLLFITLLLSSILLLQWWSISSFSENVSSQIGASAFEVSRSTAQSLIFEQPKIKKQGYALSTSQKITQTKLNNLLTRVRRNVTIELHNEQKDDYVLLNTDGSEFRIPIPRTGIHKALEDFSNKVFYSTLVLLFLGISIAIYFINKITSPLKKLQQASLIIGQGNLGKQIQKDTQWHSSEIDITIDSFNQMSSQIKQLQEQNLSLQDKAHLAELAEIARGLAHTIRNPLNTLNLAIDQIESYDKNIAHEQKELCKLSKLQVKRIDQWVRSLMNIMNHDENLIQPVNLSKCIQSVINDLNLSSQQPVQIIYSCEIENTHDMILMAIDSELKSLLQSLIANAIEASKSNNKNTITINLKQFLQGFHVKIIDQGNGFSQSILDKLYTPHNTNKTYGAGMGLYLAERVTKHHYKGDLNIKNNTDVGSCVTLILNDRAGSIHLTKTQSAQKNQEQLIEIKQHKDIIS